MDYVAYISVVNILLWAKTMLWKNESNDKKNTVKPKFDLICIVLLTILLHPQLQQHPASEENSPLDFETFLKEFVLIQTQQGQWGQALMSG